MTDRRQPWRLVSAALGGVLLIAGASCIRITITTPGPQVVRPHILDGDGGGVFAAVQAAPITSNPATICGNPVPGPYVRFSNPYLTQTPDAGFTGFRGTVFDLNTALPISNTDYYLQYFVNVANNGCCTNVPGSGTEIGCKVTAGLPYRFTAFFKTGHVPPSDHQIQLQGAWTH